MSAARDLLRAALHGDVAGVLRAAAACAILAGMASVLLLALSGRFLTAAAVAGASGAAAVAAFNYLIPSAAIRGLAILRTGTRYGERLLSHRAALLAVAQWRATLFERLAAQDSRVAPDLSGGDATARLVGDIAALEDLIVRRPTRPAGLIAAAFACALAALAGWLAALALAALLALLPLLLAFAARRWTAAPAQAAAQALGALHTRFVDVAAARPEIIAYGIGAQVTAELETLAASVDAARAELFRAEGAVAALLVGYGALAAALVLVTASGPAAAVALALLAATAAVEAMAAFARTSFRQASVDAGLARLHLLAELPFASEARPVAARAPASVQIGRDVLLPGERAALTGCSGSGKTQLLEALAGLRKPVHRLAIDGAAPEALAAETLAAQFALAPQDAGLIAGSIADNLRVARPGVDTAAMWQALATACLADRVAAMPAQLDTQLGEAGGTLSGGERKRLSLARALLAGRPWLLLDEPSEGLDRTTEADLVARLAAWLDASGAGLLLVSHRPAPLALTSRRIAMSRVPRR